jgi:glycosyltransferase involved in cell wall biosynthesis
LVFYNHSTAERYISKGIRASKVFVALNTIDQEPIQRAREFWLQDANRLRTFREQHRIAHDHVVLFVSRLEAANRVDLLLRATARLRESLPDLRVLIIGSGPAERDLRQLADSLDLSPSVQFLGSIYDEALLAPWFMSASAFCYPVNIGLSLLHAFGYGLPVVTSDRTSAQNPEIEALKSGYNGLVFADGDVEDLAHVLFQVLTRPDVRTRLSKAAHQTAIEAFSLDNMVDGLEAAVRYCARTKTSR